MELPSWFVPSATGSFGNSGRLGVPRVMKAKPTVIVKKRGVPADPAFNLPRHFSRHWRLYFYALLAAVVTLNVLRLHFSEPYDSDGVELQNNLYWWLHGIHGRAFLGPDNFFLKIPFYLIVEKLNFGGLALLFLTFLIFMQTAMFSIFFAGVRIARLLKWKIEPHYLALGVLYLASSSRLYEYMQDAT